MIELDSAPTTLDLPPSEVVIQLEAPPLSEFFNYREYILLVNQNGDYLTDQNGNRLTAWRLVSTRSNIVDLGV